MLFIEMWVETQCERRIKSNKFTNKKKNQVLSHQKRLLGKLSRKRLEKEWVL